MTLGCGGFGGNITSDNISPRHLLNIKRLAYETAAGARFQGAKGSRGAKVQRFEAVRCRSAPALPQGSGEAGARTDFRRRTDEPDRSSSGDRAGLAPAPDPMAPRHLAPRHLRQPPQPAQPETFVCEDDVRMAVEDGPKTAGRRADDHHPSGPRCRRSGQGVRTRQAGPRKQLSHNRFDPKLACMLPCLRSTISAVECPARDRLPIVPVVGALLIAGCVSGSGAEAVDGRAAAHRRRSSHPAPAASSGA